MGQRSSTSSRLGGVGDHKNVNDLIKGWFNTPGRSDADAHEAVQSSEEFLHSWV